MDAPARFNDEPQVMKWDGMEHINQTQRCEMTKDEEKEVLELAEQFAGRTGCDAEIGPTYTFDNDGACRFAQALRAPLEAQIAMLRALLVEITDVKFTRSLDDTLDAVEEALAETQPTADAFMARIKADASLHDGVLGEVAVERTRQHSKWDGVFDDLQWTPGDWHAMIEDYNGWARRMGCMGSMDKARNRYIQIAALAVAAVEAVDTNADLRKGKE